MLDEIATGDQARRRGDLGRRPTRRGRALVRLRPRHARDPGRHASGRRSARGRPRAPGRGPHAATARRPTSPSASPTRSSASISTTLAVTGRLTVGRDPRGIALSPDESTSGRRQRPSQNVSVIDVRASRSRRRSRSRGSTSGRSPSSPDGRFAYRRQHAEPGFAVHDTNNIDLGWVLGQRLTRVRPRRIRAVRDHLARPSGQGRGRRPRRRRQPRRQVHRRRPGRDA